MNVQSKTLLRSVIRPLVTALELLNKIPENDFRELVKTSKRKFIGHSDLQVLLRYLTQTDLGILCRRSYSLLDFEMR